MKNFAVKVEGKTYWISRSVATAVHVFKVINSDLYVLVEKRGSGVQYPGLYCIVCGYLDYDETLQEGAIRELREETGMGYSIWDPDSNGETGIAAKIWNIVQYSGPNTNDPTEANVYCVKAGVGFTEGQGTKEVQEYNLQFDMYTERDAIANQDANTSKVLYNLVNGGHYNELLAIANLIYIPGESTEAEKETLLRESGVLALQEQEYAGLGDEYKITDDEISMRMEICIVVNVAHR